MNSLYLLTVLLYQNSTVKDYHFDCMTSYVHNISPAHFPDSKVFAKYIAD